MLEYPFLICKVFLPSALYSLITSALSSRPQDGQDGYLWLNCIIFGCCCCNKAVHLCLNLLCRFYSIYKNIRSLHWDRRRKV